MRDDQRMADMLYISRRTLHRQSGAMFVAMLLLLVAIALAFPDTRPVPHAPPAHPARVDARQL